MFDDAALVLEEIAPEDKNRNEVLGARVVLYMAAKKWDMAAAIASHLVKVQPENEAWWINLAYSVRRIEGVEKAEAILLRAQAIHPKVAMIAFNLACYASVTGRMEEAKERLGMPSSLIRTFGDWRLMMRISGLCGIGSADWSSFAAMFASDCAHPHPPIVCWRLSHNSDSLSVAKSQLFLPAIARNSSRIARCAGVIPSLARMASIPSLIPRNAPSMATPFPGFHMNRTLDSCLPTIRFLKSIVICPSTGLRVPI